MKTKTFAAIDIGSNAVRLLIKRADEECCDPHVALKKLILVRVPLRLGFDVFSKGKISSKKADNLVRLMKAYRLLMKIYDVDVMRACATSAMRDAANGRDVIKRIKEEADIRIEIIPGSEEAEIVYNNHIERGGDNHGNFLYVDVGGGSTELNYLSDGNLIASESFNIGTVRMLSEKVNPDEWVRLQIFLNKIHEQSPDITIIGSGGNINKLYKMAKDKDTEQNSFPVSELARMYHALKPLTVRQRMDIYGMRSDRADVIIPAAEIFLTIASQIGAKRIIVPVIGVADGIIDGLYLKSR